MKKVQMLQQARNNKTSTQNNASAILVDDIFILCVSNSLYTMSIEDLIDDDDSFTKCSKANIRIIDTGNSSIAVSMLENNELCVYSSFVAHAENNTKLFSFFGNGNGYLSTVDSVSKEYNDISTHIDIDSDIEIVGIEENVTRYNTVVSDKNIIISGVLVNSIEYTILINLNDLEQRTVLTSEEVNAIKAI